MTLETLLVFGEFASGLASSATTLLERWNRQPRARFGATGWDLGAPYVWAARPPPGSVPTVPALP